MDARGASPVLEDLGRGNWAYLQPDGSWGYSNAGLVSDGDACLLVDTLFDLAHTDRMLARLRDACPAARQIGTVVNTHANGDHCYGNQLLPDARVIASSASAEEMAELPPSALAALMDNADAFGPAGAFFRDCFGPFDFRGIELAPPDETFEGSLELQVGDKQVRLVEVGPAHTKGDVLVELPEDGVVYTGDILFIEGTPIIWEGPVQNWIDACDRITAMNASVIVPGHGPLTDARGVAGVREYLCWVRDESRARYDAGVPAREAVLDMGFGTFGHWRDRERLAVNVVTLYREFGDSSPAPNAVELFGRMAELAAGGPLPD
jgi:glyoxylase-like metal-dependent hydrolase (beta-lactamase superfamily II)